VVAYGWSTRLAAKALPDRRSPVYWHAALGSFFPEAPQPATIAGTTAKDQNVRVIFPSVGDAADTRGWE
jgi:hypothetical protein